MAANTARESYETMPMLTSADRSCNHCEMVLRTFDGDICPFYGGKLTKELGGQSNGNTESGSKPQNPAENHEHHATCRREEGLETLYPNELQPEYLEERDPDELQPEYPDETDGKSKDKILSRSRLKMAKSFIRKALKAKGLDDIRKRKFNGIPRTPGNPS
jgi:hypothetical protein